jgi:F0F1-type ATP synthase epsilon subunit
MSNIKSLKTSKDPLAFISDGIAVWTPRHANTVFQRCRYHRNRDESRAKMHIDALARQMRNDEWLPRSPLDFARLPDGTLTIVNGHHRLLAQVASGRDIEWQIIIHDCQDEDEVASLFWRFDTVVRKRTATNMLAGVNAAENFQMTKQGSVALARAVVFIDNGMRSTAGTQTKIYTPPEKLRLMTDWQQEGRLYEAAIAPAQTRLRSKLYGAQVMSVALVTFRANADHAHEFWNGVASDDGLNRGDPRKTLLDFIRDTHAASTGMTATAVACARAWAAWESGRGLGMIRVGRTPVRIAGTSVTVAP